MGKKGSETRQRVLDVTTELILAKGYSGTSIDEIILKADLTKGGFFYHFESKIDLAKHLLIRFLKQEEQLVDDLIERACDLTEDPLQRVLIFLKLYAETLDALPEALQGCLVAAYTYESQHLNEEIHSVAQQGFNKWRDQFLGLLNELPGKYQAKGDVDLTQLAEMFMSLTEGSLILARVFQDASKMSQQIMLYRKYVKLLFEE